MKNLHNHVVLRAVASRNTKPSPQIKLELLGRLLMTLLLVALVSLSESRMIEEETYQGR